MQLLTKYKVWIFPYSTCHVQIDILITKSKFDRFTLKCPHECLRTWLFWNVEWFTHILPDSNSSVTTNRIPLCLLTFARAFGIYKNDLHARTHFWFGLMMISLPNRNGTLEARNVSSSSSSYTASPTFSFQMRRASSREKSICHVHSTLWGGTDKPLATSKRIA